MIVNLENIQTLTDDLENTLTRTLGFELPAELSFEEAMQLVSTIQDPLRTQIKERLTTRTYAIDSSDLRWTILNIVVRFGVRFGGMRAVGEEVCQEFYDALSQTADRVFEMLQNPGRVPPTRYGYLKSIVAGFVCGFRDYDCNRIKFVNKQNFIVLDDEQASRYYGPSGEFSGISEVITNVAKEYCLTVNNAYSGLPRLVDRMAWVGNKEDLRDLKVHLQQRLYLIRVFNELLDDF